MKYPSHVMQIQSVNNVKIFPWPAVKYPYNSSVLHSYSYLMHHDQVKVGSIKSGQYLQMHNLDVFSTQSTV